MDLWPNTGENAVTPARELESKMQKISLLISLVSLALMIAGFAIVLLNHHRIKIPGTVALPFGHLFSLHSLGDGFTEMTVGIILLAALPTARILLAIWLYIRNHTLIDTIVAIVVLLELIFSAHV